MSESSPETQPARVEPLLDSPPPIESASNSVSEIESGALNEGPVKATSISDAQLVGFERIDPRFVMLERVGGWIGWAVVATCVVIPLACAFIFAWLPIIWLLALTLLAIVILSWIGWMAQVFPRLQYESTGWRLDDSGFVMRSGVLWRKVVSVPRARVQHADVHQGPLMRYLGLAQLVIHTAGTQNASVEIQGLNHKVAEKVRDALIEDREMNDGV
jgi:membrane protein YdbS with pleckstrin-like domain